MAKYSFDYSIDTTGLAKISVSQAGIIFSREAIALLDAPAKINIGLDRTKKVVGIRPATPNESIKAFDFVTNEKRQNWIRIQSKQLVAEIAKTANLTLGKESVPFLATLEEEEGVKYLIVELKKK